MDGYPYSYASFKTRLHRWIRGDFQIYSWIKKYIIDKKEIKKKNPLNFLSKYKIFDNLIRAIHPITIMLLIITTLIINIFCRGRRHRRPARTLDFYNNHRHINIPNLNNDANNNRHPKQNNLQKRRKQISKKL